MGLVRWGGGGWRGCGIWEGRGGEGIYACVG